MGRRETDVRDFQVEPIAAGDDRAVLRIVGEIDVYTAPRLREQVFDLAGRGTVHIIADMRGVEFIDSTGLGALVGGLKRLRTSQGTLSLVIDADRILRVFQVTGLTRVFPYHSSLPEAIAADGCWRGAVEDGGRSVEEWCREHSLF